MSSARILVMRKCAVVLALVFGALHWGSFAPAAGSDIGFSGEARSENDTFIRDALQIRLTSKGLAFLGARIESLLRTNGFELRRQGRPKVELHLSRPIRLAEIPTGESSGQANFAEIAASIDEWLAGRIRLSNPMPRFVFEQASYEISDSSDGTRKLQLKVQPDHETTIRWNREGGFAGAVFGVALSVPSLKISAETIRITDPMNPLLGEWIFGKPVVNIGAADRSLQLNFKVLVTGTPEGTAFVRVLSSSSNIGSMPVSANFASLRIPSVTVKVNGRSYPVDSAPLVREIRGKLPQLAAIVRSSVAEGLSGEFLPMIEANFNAWLSANRLGQIALDVPTPCSLMECADSTAKLQLGFDRSVLGVDHDRIAGESDLRLRFFADWGAGPGNLVRGFFSLLPNAAEDDSEVFEIDMTPIDSRVDGVVAVDARIYNHVLARSWAQGWRPEVPDYTLIGSPRVEVVESSRGSKTLLRAPLEIIPESFTEAQLFGTCGVGAGIYDAYRVDAAIQLEATSVGEGSNEIDLIRGGLDVEETLINPDQFSSCAINSVFLLQSLEDRQAALLGLVRSELENISAQLAARPKVLFEALPMPKNLLGVGLQLRHAELREGRIILHLQFKESAR